MITQWQLGRFYFSHRCRQTSCRVLAQGPSGTLSFAYIVDTPLDADYFSQFGKLKRLRAYEKREIRRFYNWVLEQIVANLNKYKDGFQVTVRAWLANASFGEGGWGCTD